MDWSKPSTWGLATLGAVAAVQIVLVLVWWHGTLNAYLPVNYGFAIEIGLLVGATEMISRYRDDPFAPLVSAPGAFYILVNGGAAALAYYLMTVLKVLEGNEPMRTLTAGLGAMAFFRSGVFTMRIGGSDIAVGPNIVLQVILQALDRTYDRDRAVPRSKAVLSIMSGVGFAQVKDALPTLCFDLMQNVSDAEISQINSQITALSAATMSDDVKILSLGLALFNVVGEETLRAAVCALGSKIQGYQQVGTQMLIDLAKVLAASDAATVATTLPDICAQLPSPPQARDSEATVAPSFDVSMPGLAAESAVMLLLYKLVAFYGDQRVSVALGILANQSSTSGADTAVGAVQPPAPAPQPGAQQSDPRQPGIPAPTPSQSDPVVPQSGSTDDPAA